MKGWELLVEWKDEVKEGFTSEQVRNGECEDMIGYQEITPHIVFDIKMEFTRKARFVAGGHTTGPQQVQHSRVWSHGKVYELR
jgi:hypothetical protein